MLGIGSSVIIWQISKEESFQSFHFPILYMLSLNAFADWIAGPARCLPVGAGLLIDLLKLVEKQILDPPSRNKMRHVVDVLLMSVE